MVASGGPGSGAQCPQRGHGGDGAGLFTAVQGERARDDGRKLKQEVRRGYQGNFFCVRTVKWWHRLPEMLFGLQLWDFDLAGGGPVLTSESTCCEEEVGPESL